MRRPSPVSSVPIGSSNNIISSLAGLTSSLGEKISSAFATRKSASGDALGFAERVGEFISRNVPSIEPGVVMDLMLRAQTPLLIALGVTAAAGIVYLAYRLYKHFTEKNAKDTINTIMEDLRNIAPDVFKVEGWSEQIEADVADAVTAGPEEMIKRIAEIKTKIFEKQHATDPKKIGGGINVFRKSSNARGAGLMTI